MKYDAHGLEFDLVASEMSGPLARGRYWTRLLLRLVLGLPGLALIAAVLLAPLVTTAVWATGAPEHITDFVRDPVGRNTLVRTGCSILFAVALVLLGFLFAHVTRGVERLWRVSWMVFVLPFGASALVSGTAFRLIFDPESERGLLSFVASWFGWEPTWLRGGWMWIVLALAFTWTWFGFIVAMFRASLNAIERDPTKQSRLEKAKGWADQRWLELRMIQPVGFIVGVIVTVAAARVFDLILIAAPGSTQFDVDVVGVQWWRLTQSTSDPSVPAAYLLPFTVLPLLFALIVMWRTGKSDSGSGVQPPSKPLDIEVGRGSKRRHLVGTLIGTFAVAVPVIVLLATAFHSPVHASTTGFWVPELPTLDSFARAMDAGLWRSVGITAWVAGAATVILMGAALPIAYWLAAHATSRLAKPAVWLLIGLALMPVQAYIAPLQVATEGLGIAGSRIPLILVHAAAGLPFAVLVLRGALQAPEKSLAADTLFGLTSPRTTIRRIWRQAGPALIAVTALEIVQVWNDFIISFLISGPGSSPLTLVLWGEARQFAFSSGTVAASASLSAVLPVTILLLTWRKYIVPGLTGGVLR